MSAESKGSGDGQEQRSGTDQRSGEDRRLHPRIAIRLPAVYRLEDSVEERQGSIRDLSVGGVALITKEHIPSGALVSQIRFSPLLPTGGARPVSASAVVVHSRALDPEGEERGFIAGLHFLYVDAHLSEKLTSFVFERLKRSEIG